MGPGAPRVSRFASEGAPEVSAPFCPVLPVHLWPCGMFWRQLVLSVRLALIWPLIVLGMITEQYSTVEFCIVRATTSAGSAGAYSWKVGAGNWYACSSRASGPAQNAIHVLHHYSADATSAGDCHDNPTTFSQTNSTGQGFSLALDPVAPLKIATH